MRRKLIGISQERLADSLGLTFQQVQKYERGANRISASKLYETSRTLEVAVSYFFEGLEGSAAEIARDEEGKVVREFLQSPEGLALARVFTRIGSGRIRRQILELAQALAEEER